MGVEFSPLLFNLFLEYFDSSVLSAFGFLCVKSKQAFHLGAEKGKYVYHVYQYQYQSTYYKDLLFI